jgi:hypothetical protein
MVTLLSLNWRLALMAMAIIPGAMLMSFANARRIRPIYRTVRKDVEEIDGRALIGDIMAFQWYTFLLLPEESNLSRIRQVYPAAILQSAVAHRLRRSMTRSEAPSAIRTRVP